MWLMGGMLFCAFCAKYNYWDFFSFACSQTPTERENKDGAVTFREAAEEEISRNSWCLLMCKSLH